MILRMLYVMYTALVLDKQKELQAVLSSRVKEEFHPLLLSLMLLTLLVIINRQDFLSSRRLEVYLPAFTLSTR